MTSANYEVIMVPSIRASVKKNQVVDAVNLIFFTERGGPFLP
jgi:hypothetical protein